MSTAAPLKIHGIAGGVGATVLASILEGVEVDSPADADVIVARNDYRCAKALASVDWYGVLRYGTGRRPVVVLLVEPGRALDEDDFRAILPTGTKLVVLDTELAIARADDAGLLLTTNLNRRTMHYASKVREALQ